MYTRLPWATLLIWSSWSGLFPIPYDDKNAAREEGVFQILVRGKQIGTEKYVFALAGDSASSTSVLDFRNPNDIRQKVRLESKLEMDGRFRPRDYRLHSDVDGKKGSIVGSFSPNQAIFEYGREGPAKKRGLLVGKDYTILDSNLFHHFIFLARLFDFEHKEGLRRFEVVIPQAADSGFVKVSELKKETLMIGGKKAECYQLQVDSGTLIIHLWVDKQRLVHKILVPSLEIEVVRNP